MSICSSHVCVNLTKKFWLLVNQPASYGRFRPKLWKSLVTLFVEIFEKEKKWWGSGPIWVTSWKEFSISLRKNRGLLLHGNLIHEINVSWDKSLLHQEISLPYFYKVVRIISDPFWITHQVDWKSQNLSWYALFAIHLIKL